MEESLMKILEFFSEYIFYIKIIIILAIIVHCLFKRYDKLSIKYRSKAFAILIFAYIITDFTESTIRKYYIKHVYEEIHNQIYNKIDNNYIDLDTKIKMMSDKIYDDYNIKPKDTLK